MVGAQRDRDWRVGRRRCRHVVAIRRCRRRAAGAILFPKLGAPILEPNLNPGFRELDPRS